MPVKSKAQYKYAKKHPETFGEEWFNVDYNELPGKKGKRSSKGKNVFQNSRKRGKK